jgi:hypothetical protein
MISAKTVVSGNMQSVSVHPRHIVYFYRDDNTGLVRLRLTDGSDAITDLRILRVSELVAGEQ